MAVLVAKADGTMEEFVPQKLVHSLLRAGADSSVAQEITQEIQGELYAGITTEELYRHAFAHLRAKRRSVAARYSLKRAVLDFGPSGFPFEAYIAELLSIDGYVCKVDQVIKGVCVEHEVDVVAHKGTERLYVEAKFHNTLGFKTDLKTALYVKARMDDIRAAVKARAEGDAPERVRGLIVTNTKFTSHAVRYAECAGVELLGWEYPHGETLHTKIERAKLYPLTALTTLSRHEKLALLQKRIVLCSSLPHETRALAEIGVVGQKAASVLQESSSLCGSDPGVK